MQGEWNVHGSVLTDVRSSPFIGRTITLNYKQADKKNEVAVRMQETLDHRFPAELVVQYIPSLGFLVCVGLDQYEFRPPLDWEHTVRHLAARESA
jgi:hypothetical protein